MKQYLGYILGTLGIILVYVFHYRDNPNEKYFEILLALSISLIVAQFAGYIIIGVLKLRMPTIIYVPILLVSIAIIFGLLNLDDILKTILEIKKPQTEIPKPVPETVPVPETEPETEPEPDISSKNKIGNLLFVNVYDLFGVADFEHLKLNGEKQTIFSGGEYRLYLKKGDRLELKVSEDLTKTKIWQQD